MQPVDPDFIQHILLKKRFQLFRLLTSKNLSKLFDLSGFYGTNQSRVQKCFLPPIFVIYMFFCSEVFSEIYYIEFLYRYEVEVQPS